MITQIMSVMMHPDTMIPAGFNHTKAELSSAFSSGLFQPLSIFDQFLRIVWPKLSSLGSAVTLAI